MTPTPNVYPMDPTTRAELHARAKGQRDILARAIGIHPRTLDNLIHGKPASPLVRNAVERYLAGAPADTSSGTYVTTQQTTTTGVFVK